ncbi:MAG TPA: TetR/AcrR family transcriptional regulator [Solirubrobacterales bacterium]
MPKPTNTEGRAREGAARRSPAKREAILDAATDLFLRGGYLGTTVDQIAARAGVAKQTVYEHFGGKEALFNEIVLRTIDQVGRPFFELIADTEDGEDVESWLRDLARRLVRVVREPRLLELRRLVIAEVGRFPELGRVFAERGHGRTVEALQAKFERLREAGLLAVEDAGLAAQQFNWLVLSIPINRAMFDPRARFTEDELDRWADEAVRIFRAAYLADG